MLELTINLNRTADYDIDLYESDGTTPATVSATDTIRLKIGRGSAIPQLDVASSEALSGGTLLTITATGDSTTPARVRLHIAQGDVASIPAGCYDLEIDVVDDSEEEPENGIKLVTQGIAYLQPSLGGGVSL